MKRILFLSGICIALIACSRPSGQHRENNELSSRTAVQPESGERNRHLSPAARQALDEGARWFASGNEPGWSVVLYEPERGAVLHTAYGTETYVFDRYQKEEHEGHLVFKATSTNNTFTLRLVKETCTDNAGQDFPYSSTIRFLGSTWYGCALPLAR